MDATPSDSDNEVVSYEATMPYGDRKTIDTSQHRQQIPPAHVSFSNSGPCIDIDHGAAPAYSKDAFGNSAFMSTVAQSRPTKLAQNILSWKFENRYQAQMIVPFLYLGPSTAARDSKFMKEAGITYLMAVRSSTAVRLHPKFINPAILPTAVGRQTGTFDIDTPYEFISNVRPAIKRVVDHLEASCTDTSIASADDIPAKVLVYCENGSDRSAVFVTAFLMVFYGLSTSSAIQLMQSQRFSVTIDENMRNMLLDFEEILMAERQVFVAHLQAQQAGCAPHQSLSDLPGLKAATKRTMSTVEEEDEDVIGEQWSEAQQRGGTAPFRDVRT